MSSSILRTILNRYAQNRPDDRPDSFYSWRETKVLLKVKQKQLNSRQANYLNTPYQLITKATQLEAALKPFQSASIIGLDCETTGLDPLQDKIRLVQLAIPEHPVIVIDLKNIEANALAPLQSILISNSLKIGHHLKFDWQFLSQMGLTLHPPFFDTYLAYRVLTAGLKKNSSLEAIAAKFLNIKLNKSFQKSNFREKLSSAQLQYAATDAFVVLLLYKILKRRLEKAQLTQTAQDEFNCLPMVAQMELNGIHLDLKKWQQLGDRLKIEQKQLEQEISQQLKPPQSRQISLLPEFAQIVNLRSPKQVITTLNDIGIAVKSTNAEDLIPLAPDYPLIQSLLQYRSLSARISTFTEGLPEHIHPVTGRIHGNWFQHGAKSGRFSCREPNLTNIPRDAQTRQCFTAEPGNVLIKADYSQIELRLIAKVSGDRRMCQAYRTGEDLHRLTASLIFGKPLMRVTDEERRLGKIVNFGLIYGMGVSKFRITTAKKHGIILSQQEASQFRQTFFEAYTGLKAYHAKIRSQWQQGIRESRTIDGRRRLWSQQKKPTLNELLNHPIQGANATILKRAIALLGHFGERKNVKLIAVIHDEILLECPDKESPKVAFLLKRCMVKVAKQLLEPIPIEVDILILPSWGG